MSQGLSEVTSFFKTTGANTDVTPAINATAWIFKITTFIVSVIGFGGMAIYVLRIAVDIILIVGRGITFLDKLAPLGTGKDGKYESATQYLGHNVPQIVITMIIIIFLITGWIFNLVAMAVNGVGSFINWISGTDVISTASSLVVQSYVERIPTRGTQDLKKEYDTETKNAQNYFRELDANKSPSEDDPKYAQTKSMYTQSMAKAQILSEELTKKRNAGSELKLGTDYFEKHLRQNDDGTSFCRDGFLSQDILDNFGTSVQCK